MFLMQPYRSSEGNGSTMFRVIDVMFSVMLHNLRAITALTISKKMSNLNRATISIVVRPGTAFPVIFPTAPLARFAGWA
jgi:hypothetical protein